MTPIRSSLTLFAVCAGLAAGCSNPAPNETQNAPPARQSATTNQINPLNRDQIKDGGKFTLPIGAMPVNFNYNEVDGTDFDNVYILGATMPNMFRSDAAARPLWNPDYLASEPTLVTEPKQVVTYAINPKAVWTDGTPITWVDFQWQWKASNGADKRYQISASNGYEDIEGVERGKDDREVIVTFKHKYADWQPIFNPLYPTSTNKDPKLFNEGWKERPLVTSGPFKVDKVDHAAKTVTLVRNEKWWGAPAKLDTMVFRAIDINAHIDALANGEVDFIDVGPDVNAYQRAKAIATAELRIAGGPNFRHVTINGTSPNLQDVRVRQAVAMGINRSALARAQLTPLGITPEPLGNHIFMANQNGYQDNSGNTGKYDPEKAKQLLDEAGWKLEGTVRKKNGKPLEITVVIPAAVTASKQESELIQNMLGQLGVTVKINTVPLKDFFDKYIRPGQFDVTLFSWMGTAYPISSVKSIYSMPTKDAKGELIVQQNYARTGSAEIDARLLAARTELDRAKAIELANQADSMIWQQVHSLTLYQRPEIIAVRKGLANFGAFGFADPIYQDIGWAK